MAGQGEQRLRKLGIVGGTSWSSTALYYEHINRGVAKRLGALHSARLAIESLDLAPIAKMELSDDWDGVAAVLIDAAKKLKASGADGLLLASNTSHKVYDQVVSAVRLPVLHIGDPTATGWSPRAHPGSALNAFTGPWPCPRPPGSARHPPAPIYAGWVRECDRIIFANRRGRSCATAAQVKTLTTSAQAKGPGRRLGLHRAVARVDTRRT